MVGAAMSTETSAAGFNGLNKSVVLSLLFAAAEPLTDDHGVMLPGEREGAYGAVSVC